MHQNGQPRGIRDIKQRDEIAISHFKEAICKDPEEEEARDSTSSRQL